MPSKTPAAEPGPPDSPGPSDGRLPLMNMSTQEETNVARDAAVSAPSEKYFDHVQPPSDIMTLRFGCLALSLPNCPKLPLSGSPQVSATPSTLSSAPTGRW
jgi:hypothetical protein